MTFTTIALWLLVFGHTAFLIYDGLVQAKRFGNTLVAVRLRRRLADAVFFSVIIVAGLYYEIAHGKNTPNIIALALFLALVLAHGLRYPKWRLKKDGFTAGGRYWPYEAIAAMRLSEDGVLVLTLLSGQNLILPVAHIDDLEKAAAFFTGEDALAHLFNRPAQEPAMPYRAIFTDIDGTLLTSAHVISPRTLAAVQHVASLGLPFILVSARPPLAISPFVAQIGVKQPLIAFNGALILDGDLQTLHSITLDNADLRQLETLLESRAELSPNYYRGTEWYSPRPDNAWTAQEGAITGLAATAKPQALADVHKILVMGEAPVIAALEAELKSAFPHLQISRSKDTYLEIVHKSVTKSGAIRFLQERLGVPREALIAFGDNFNDLDMLRHAGYGVAMGNAPQAIREQAAHVTASNNEDGMAIVLERLFPKT